MSDLILKNGLFGIIVQPYFFISKNCKLYLIHLHLSNFRENSYFPLMISTEHPRQNTKRTSREGEEGIKCELGFAVFYWEIGIGFLGTGMHEGRNGK